MPDQALLLDMSHVVTFVVGTAVGAAGTYMADKYTDARRRKEAESSVKAKFASLRVKMPALFDELKNDLAEHPELAIREFVVLLSANTIFNHDKPRLEYYEATYPAIQNWVAMLVDSGFVTRINEGGTGATGPNVFAPFAVPIYRLSENFVERLQGGA